MVHMEREVNAAIVEFRNKHGRLPTAIGMNWQDLRQIAEDTARLYAGLIIEGKETIEAAVNKAGLFHSDAGTVPLLISENCPKGTIQYMQAL